RSPPDNVSRWGRSPPGWSGQPSGRGGGGERSPRFHAAFQRESLRPSGHSVRIRRAQRFKDLREKGTKMLGKNAVRVSLLGGFFAAAAACGGPQITDIGGGGGGGNPTPAPTQPAPAPPPPNPSPSHTITKG